MRFKNFVISIVLPICILALQANAQVQTDEEREQEVREIRKRQFAEAERAMALARKTFEGLPIDQKKVQINSASFQDGCFNGIFEDPENAKLVFSIRAKEAVKFGSYTYPKGTELSFCDGKIAYISIYLYNERGSFAFDGYQCEDDIQFTKKGKLCGCTLAVDTKIDGYLVPAKSPIVISKGKVKFITLRAVPFSGDLDRYYKIKKGKLVDYPGGESERCEFDE